jgi:GntR family transcriptional regulator
MAVPMYQQIAEALRAEIESGRFPPGQQMPTELELREQFSASRSTIRDATKLLMNLGLVEARPGQGIFVTEKIDPFVSTLSDDPSAGDSVVYQYQVSQHGRTPSHSGVRVEVQTARQAIAAELAIQESDPVVSRHQQRFIDGSPWSTQTSFYPMGLATKAPGLLQARAIEAGAVQYLADVLGLRQAGYRDWITVRAPDATEAQFFSLPRDGRVAVFEIFRTAFDQYGTPIRVTVTVYPADRNQFVVLTGDVPAQTG